MNRTAFRLLNLLLCALLLGPMSLPAWAIARPENRVGKIFSSPLKSASADLDQTLEPRRESRGCGYDFASGVHKYLYAFCNPIMYSDPTGRISLSDMMKAVGIIGRWAAQLYSRLPAWVRWGGIGASRGTATRAIIGVAVIVAEAWYVFNYQPGLAAVQTKDGKTFGGTWWNLRKLGNVVLTYEDFKRNVNSCEPGSIKKVVITGHAGKDYSNDDFISIGDDVAWGHGPVNNLAATLTGKLTSDAVIYLNGCNSAGLARELSLALPGVTVVGYNTRIPGGSGVGINAACGFWSRIDYRNGVAW